MTSPPSETSNDARALFFAGLAPEKCFPQGKPRVGHTTVWRNWAAVLRRDPCAYCGRRSESVDHITPDRLAEDTPENLTGACLSCNGTKGIRRSLLSMLASARFPISEVS